jgi:hypothetical protein
MTDLGDAMKRLFAVLFLLLIPLPAHAGTQEIFQTGMAWLAQLDAGQYAESYDATGPYFHSVLTKDQWIAIIKKYKEDLGAPTARGKATMSRVSQLPNLPSGDYMVIEMDTTFAIKGRTKEYVILMHENDEWKPVTYFVK